MRDSVSDALKRRQEASNRERADLTEKIVYWKDAHDEVKEELLRQSSFVIRAKVIFEKEVSKVILEEFEKLQWLDDIKEGE